jgi:anti-sigma regulatory factor (Ser/Thr protein kinase)
MVRREIGDAHPAAADAVACVSELVTNAVAHTRSGRPGGTVRVSVETWAPATVWLRVADEGRDGIAARPPTAGWLAQVSRDPAPGAEHGFGLLIVAALADGWGAYTIAGGSAAWCRITREDTAR